MKTRQLRHFSLVAFSAAGLLLSGCAKDKKPDSKNIGDASTITGISYGEEGAFNPQQFDGQKAGPGLVYIEGGYAQIGNPVDDTYPFRNTQEHKVTVRSFLLDETEVANIHWQEYMHYVRKDSSKEVYEASLPDTTVWATDLGFNDPMVEHYYSYPGYRFYPVVGVSWLQAQDYCIWRTNVVNGLQDNFASDGTNTWVNTAINEGTTLPNYRLPTEQEWEYAAMAFVGVSENEDEGVRRIYPWTGHSLRNPYGNKKPILKNKRQTLGQFMANFKRGRGDYGGVAGQVKNDGAFYTDYIYAFPPNDFHLYNMAGNVSEWVEDTFKPISLLKDEETGSVPTELTYGTPEFDPESDMFSAYSEDFKVYKGGSWADVAFWLSPGTRRYMAFDSSSSTVGFRCAMDQLDQGN